MGDNALKEIGEENTLLLVDDDEGARYITGKLLRRHKRGRYRVIAAHVG